MIDQAGMVAGLFTWARARQGGAQRGLRPFQRLTNGPNGLVRVHVDQPPDTTSRARWLIAIRGPWRRRCRGFQQLGGVGRLHRIDESVDLVGILPRRSLELVEQVLSGESSSLASLASGANSPVYLPCRRPPPPLAEAPRCVH